MTQRLRGAEKVNLRPPKVVACIPAFNEEKNIASVVLGVTPFVDQVIVCDDGSSDLTGQIAATMGATVIAQERNRMLTVMHPAGGGGGSGLSPASCPTTQ